VTAINFSQHQEKQMKPTRLRSLRAPVLLAAAMVGLAVSASGCVIDGSSGNTCGNPAGCYPDLTIFWQIRSDITAGKPLITCDAAGGADTVVALIDNGCLGTQLTEFDGPCPVGAVSGSFVAQLPAPSTYDVSLELHSGGPTGPKLSETSILVQPVGCSGAATPTADMFVNY
jgi:hypothetical protein